MIAKLTIAACLAIYSTVALCAEDKVQTCQMSVMNIANGEMSGEPRAAGDAIVTSGSDQFYVLIGERVIASPLLVERKGNLVAFHSGTAYLMQKESYSVIYDDFGYVFDECVKVS